ncbi:MAG TPA: PQQ-dependent dehydrogenase, methanol/ethanol family [Steroidobacteraceae bacterium]|nr:PQQ-dependent dehydrogenase, methanol/ethanol family [Steroidobacteraceae bacterium]
MASARGRIAGTCRGAAVALCRMGILAGLALLSQACARAAEPSAGVSRDQAGPLQGQWPVGGRTFEEQYFSPLRQIDTQTVQRLGFAWEFRDFVVRGRTHRGVQSTPLFVDGVLYFSGPWGVAYAVDAHTGKSLWSYDPQPDGQYARSTCCDVVNRGLALWKGRVYTASLDGYLSALDAKTGRLLWRADTFVDRKGNYTSTGAPRIAGNNVVIGNAGAEFGIRGYVSAYDLVDGHLVWRFWSVPGDPARGPDENPDVTFARKSWAADTRWDLGGGGSAWDSMVYDPALGLIYLGLGNGDPHPRWERSPGGGDNLFVSSIVAVAANTGRVKWYYQETPGDSWDYDATAPIVLADLRWGGQLRHVLMQAAKNGIFYVIDRAKGELLEANPFTTVTWTDGIDLKTGRPRQRAGADYSRDPRIVWPSGAGGHGWQPMSFNPGTGLVYVPVYDAPMKFRTEPVLQTAPGLLNQGEAGSFPPFNSAADRDELQHEPTPKVEGRLKAWDPQCGCARWISPPLPFGNGGTLSTAGNLVFQGASDGTLSAYDALSGRLLKRVATGTAILAAPMSYQLDGVQYVAVLAGAGGPQASRFAPDVAAAHYENYERLLVFKLDGTSVPLPQQRPPAVPQPTPPAIAADAATLEQGARLFHLHCERCHVIGGALAAYPDLWNMAPGTLNSFDRILLQGLFRYAGMADFSDVLSSADVAALKAFIVSDERQKRTRGSQAGEHSHAVVH